MLPRCQTLRWLQQLCSGTKQPWVWSPLQKNTWKLGASYGRGYCEGVIESTGTKAQPQEREDDSSGDMSVLHSLPTINKTNFKTTQQDSFGDLQIGDEFYQANSTYTKAKTASNSTSAKINKKGRKMVQKKGGATEIAQTIQPPIGAVMHVDIGDKFGLLAAGEEDSIEEQRFEKDEMEVDETEKPFIRLSTVNRKHSPTWYGRKIAKLGKQGKVYEAIKVYEEEMLEQDRVKPDAYLFAELIAVVGRVGYTKKAFSLFNQMKKFGIRPVDPIYTSLFNACAYSPWPEDGLRRAVHLRNTISESGHQMSLITYRAAIKAFSRCGDIQEAFCIADEAARYKLKQCPKMFSALLMGCISDETAGFKHAIEVWKLMKKKRIRPDSYTYNLLLRAVRDCGVGDTQFVSELIQSGSVAESDSDVSPSLNQNTLKMSESRLDPGAESTPSESRKLPDPSEAVCDTSGAISEKLTAQSDNQKHWWEYDLNEFIKDEDSVSSDQINISEKTHLARSEFTQEPNLVSQHVPELTQQHVPDILNPGEKFEMVLSLGDLTTGEARLGLLGGLQGFLARMQKDRVPPNIKTFSILLDVIPASPEVEQELLDALQANNVKIDIDFLNLLIRKKNLRKDKAGVQVVVELIGKHMLSPNIMTYGCLAMGCHNIYEAKNLFHEMENAGVRPNKDIFTIMIVQSKQDFGYKHYLCHMMKKMEVMPSKSLIQSMESSVKFAWDALVASERGEPVSDYFCTKKFKVEFRTFMRHYKPWLRSMPLEQKVHPWAAYRAPALEAENAAMESNMKALP